MPLKPKPKPKRRTFVTQDGTAIARSPIVYGESFPIAGAAVAMDARPKPPAQPITFDGAVPSLQR